MVLTTAFVLLCASAVGYGTMWTGTVRDRAGLARRGAPAQLNHMHLKGVLCHE